MGLNDPQPQPVRVVTATGADEPQAALVTVDSTAGQPDGWAYGDTRVGVQYNGDEPDSANQAKEIGNGGGIYHNIGTAQAPQWSRRWDNNIGVTIGNFAGA